MDSPTGNEVGSPSLSHWGYPCDGDADKSRGVVMTSRNTPHCFVLLKPG